MEPTRELVPRLRFVRSVRVVMVAGMEPAKRFVARPKNDIFTQYEISEGREPDKQLEESCIKASEVSEPMEGGRDPPSLLLPKESAVNVERPEISEGREPVKLFEPKSRLMTFPFEQVRPVHTGEEHFEATYAQFHEENKDWMLVELIRAHKVSSLVRANAK
jgi:hypothetical protein